MEKTRDLLTPVVDLITLQTEMQAALKRLAASLETFATGVISENIDKTATVESRLETLERELEQTRARLRETEALLAAGAVAAAAPQPLDDQDTRGAAAAAPSSRRRRRGRSAGADAAWDLDSTAETPREGLLVPHRAQPSQWRSATPSRNLTPLPIWPLNPRCRPSPRSWPRSR